LHSGADFGTVPDLGNSEENRRHRSPTTADEPSGKNGEGSYSRELPIVA
jgi:hypothetical protein